MPEERIVEQIYGWLADGKANATHSLGKCFIIESHVSNLPDDLLLAILDDVEKKKTYKFELFDMFVHLLATFTGSQDLHQEIGLYLGVNRFELGRIYQTLSGDRVRSKSEVIIGNILYQSGIPFAYEKELKAAGKPYSPDFTITWKGKTYFGNTWVSSSRNPTKVIGPRRSSGMTRTFPANCLPRWSRHY